MNNKSLGGFHLAKQNVMEWKCNGRLRLDQAVTGNQGYFEG